VTSLKAKQKKTVLIFGGGGFIGSHMVESLINDFKVIVFDKKNFSKQNISTFEGHIEIIEGDFGNHLDWQNALNAVDYVIHLICTTLPAASNENCTYDVESNVLPSLKLFDALRKNTLTRLVFISSGGTVYGNVEKLPIHEEAVTNPICSYGIGKLMIEKYLHLYHTVYGLDYRTARLSNAYGERQNTTSNQGLITTILQKVLQGQPVEIWGDGLVVRDYIYVKDASDCIKKMLTYHGPERTFNVSSNTGYSVNEVIEAISQVIGRKIEIAYSSERKFDVRDNILNNALAERELGWKPKVSLPEGITLVYEWLRGRAKE
jgi:UDP-glucose 4-epimerase